ncbi:MULTISPECIES: HAMP domain-containing sensor histidine kinase [unclassified Bacillus (in: firmicutes)]|uniref:sensor histidine kinase n=1 Tax=unclassified Bacillus (in: firmicutes) TaxID=185979 RepID=UPI001BE8CAB4|nr:MULTISPECIES: HAMP domain-containing sensor histidine kinase [unclassified Bacillus (in: firmicutes)]MBT2724700.1 HAMP domain-containing histidine kinase [Bacillus sp. ISL-46]MBT2742598.1 HAMP domain-containing histidine kinase [Bacillus sp. ISL-77]
MKGFYTHINKKLYYFTILIIIAIMIMGLLMGNPRFGKFDAGYIFHSGLVVILSACLLLYPKYITHVFRLIIITVASVYFYALFFLYPDTWSTFIFLCFIPAIAILFFDSKLFYFSLLLNSVSIIFTFSYIMLIDQGYPYIKQDLIGNVINFIGSQVIIYFIFYLTQGRIKKQQLYYEQIQHSERLKTTGQLAAAVAHEIRNPLTVVKGFLQLYQKDAGFSDDIKGNFTLMIDELNIAEQVITQFLSIAKPNKETEVETVNLKVVLQNVTDLLHSYGLLHDNKIELIRVEDCYIAANNIEFKQLLINIIKNAIEASKIGDSVIVSASREKDFVEIKVVDYGQGMSEAEIKSLGTPFYSLKIKGTGLGMMVCYNIAAKYKGTIDFQSTKGEGTTVTIRFPSKNY